MAESEYYAGGHRRDAVYSSDEDDDRYKRTTVRRYKVGHGQVERVEQVERKRVEDGPDHRDQRREYHSPNSVLEADRRTYAPERPRSALEISEHTRRYYDDDGRRIVYESTKDIDRDAGRHARNGEVFSNIRRDERDDEIIVESYSKDRLSDGHGGEVERWHKETEYYEPSIPPPTSIVIRPRPVEQRIILQEAPQPPPVIVPRHSQGALVAHERERPRKKECREEDGYYYEHRERLETRPFRSDREDLVVEQLGRHDRNPGHHHRHHHHRRDYASDGDLSSEDDYYVTKKTVIRREVSPPASEHRRHLAEGALAGAGIGALLGSRRNQDGELPENRGRKVLAGAALGALGTEVLKRAHSTYNDHFGEDREGSGSRERSRSPSHHSTLKTGLGIAAAALAVAGAAKYFQSGRVDREERNRGRSLHRYSSDDEKYHSRSSSHTSRKPRSRASSVAKVAAGTAAVAGLVHHFRSKSRGQSGKSRSHSRLRTGAEIIAAGLAGAAAKKIYDKHQDKKENEREDGLVDEEYEERRNRQLESRPHSRSRSFSRSLSRSRSRSRSQSRSGTRAGAKRSPHHPDAGYSPPSGADPELGLVEYGARPLYSDPPYPDRKTHDTIGYHGGHSSIAEDIEYGGHDQRRRNREHRSRGTSKVYDDEDDSSYADVDDGDEYRISKKGKNGRSRSRSRLRNLAAAGAGTAAAAAVAGISIKKFEDRKKVDKKNSNNETGDSHQRKGDTRGQDSVRDNRKRSREHHKDRDNTNYGYGPAVRPPSPMHASGGAFYPPPRQEAPSAVPEGLMKHSNAASTDLNGAANHTYIPLDFNGHPPPPPAPLDRTTQHAPSSGFTAPQAHGPIANPISKAAVDPRENRIRDSSPSHDTDNAVDCEGQSIPEAINGIDNREGAVTFVPLSPQSSRTLKRHHVELQSHGRIQIREEVDKDQLFDLMCPEKTSHWQ